MNVKYATTSLKPEDTSISFAEADHRIPTHLAMLGSYVRLNGVAIAQRDEPLDAEGFLDLVQKIESTS